MQRFSARSRSRLLQTVAKIDSRAIGHAGYFTTLTYPAEYSREGTDWHRDLEVWAKRLLRRHPGAWCVWKLEFQQRGAPHFHLLVFGVGHLSRHKTRSEKESAWRSFQRWLSDSWYESVGSGDEKHRRAGTNVTEIKNWRQVTAYAAKYQSKTDDTPADHPGRYWGVIGRDALPTSVVTMEIDQAEFTRLRRGFKRLLGVPAGYHPPGGTLAGVWVAADNATVRRLLTWAGEAAREHAEGGAVARPPNGATFLPAPFAAGDPGRPPAYTDWSNTPVPYGCRPRPFDRTTDTTISSEGDPGIPRGRWRIRCG